MTNEEQVAAWDRIYAAMTRAERKAHAQWLARRRTPRRTG